jgi:hypothetical protein
VLAIKSFPAWALVCKPEDAFGTCRVNPSLEFHASVISVGPYSRAVIAPPLRLDNTSDEPMNANIAKSVIANAALNTVNTHRDREVSNGVEPASSSVAAVLALTSPPSPRLALAPIKGSRSVATIARRRARVMWIAATRGGSVRFGSVRFGSVRFARHHPVGRRVCPRAGPLALVRRS